MNTSYYVTNDGGARREEQFATLYPKNTSPLTWTLWLRNWT